MKEMERETSRRMHYFARIQSPSITPCNIENFLETLQRIRQLPVGDCWSGVIGTVHPPKFVQIPVSADGIVAGEHAAVASENLERDGLPCNLGAACPHNSPVAGHSDPSGILPLDVDGADVTSTSDVVMRIIMKQGLPLSWNRTPPLLLHFTLHFTNTKLHTYISHLQHITPQQMEKNCTYKHV